MIGSLGLGLVGVGIVFLWAGVKGRRVGEFFEQLRGAGAPAVVPNPEDAYQPLPPGIAGPVLPRPPMPR